jgi:hypothetical protein
MAVRQRAGKIGGLRGRDLGAVLPTGNVTGATFYEDALTRGPRLLLALNRGTYSDVVSYAVSTGAEPAHLLSRSARTELNVPQSPSSGESEGLAVSGQGRKRSPLGGVLHWLMLPASTSSSFYSRILSYVPVPAAPPDGARVQHGQRLQTALSRGLRITVVCNHRCAPAAVAAIDESLSRRLGLTAAVGSGALRAGTGSRTLTITFRRLAQSALPCLRVVRLKLTVRSIDAYTGQRATYELSTVLVR